jgi:hypothetical protein
MLLSTTTTNAFGKELVVLSTNLCVCLFWFSLGSICLALSNESCIHFKFPKKVLDLGLKSKPASKQLRAQSMMHLKA